MRFTDRARRPVVQAQEEAKRLEHNYIGPEHLLLALTHETRLLDEYQRRPGNQAK